MATSSSPRSMWSGALRLGLLNVPVTLAKAAQEQRESALVTVCEHGVKIDRSERCGAGHEDCGLTKRKAVEKADGTLQVLNSNEYVHIEDSTKSDTLDVLDVQPLNALPMSFGMGTYYLRPDKKVRGSEQVFGILHAALAKSGMGMIVKLCRSASQRLAVVHADHGVILLTQIPFMAELRKPGDQERAHWSVDVPDEQIQLATDLLRASSRKDGFDWSSYEDEGYKLRSEAVDRVLDTKLPLGDDEPEQAPKDNAVANIMATLAASVEQAKSEKAVA